MSCIGLAKSQTRLNDFHFTSSTRSQEFHSPPSTDSSQVLLPLSPFSTALPDGRDVPRGLPHRATIRHVIKIKATADIHEDLLCVMFFAIMILACQQLFKIVGYYLLCMSKEAKAQGDLPLVTQVASSKTWI